jgi:hypothetical protein
LVRQRLSSLLFVQVRARQRAKFFAMASKVLFQGRPMRIAADEEIE